MVDKYTKQEYKNEMVEKEKVEHPLRFCLKNFITFFLLLMVLFPLCDLLLAKLAYQTAFVYDFKKDTILSFAISFFFALSEYVRIQRSIY